MGGVDIAEILEMTVEQSRLHFTEIPKVSRLLESLTDVGLGYLRLGQSALTLSGGEAQRLKLARELSRRSRGHTLYILDEPSTGLHFDDVRTLMSILQRLVDKGHSVIIIEHNPDIIREADYIIDLGPDVAYDRFVEGVVRSANAKRQKRVSEERAALRSLPLG